MLGNQLRSYDPDRYALHHYPAEGNPHDTLDAILALETEIRTVELMASSYQYPNGLDARQAAQEIQAMRDTRMALRGRLMTQVMETSSAIARANLESEEPEPPLLPGEDPFGTMADPDPDLELEKRDERRLEGR